MCDQSPIIGHMSRKRNGCPARGADAPAALALALASSTPLHPYATAVACTGDRTCPVLHVLLAAPCSAAAHTNPHNPRRLHPSPQLHPPRGNPPDLVWAGIYKPPPSTEHHRRAYPTTQPHSLLAAHAQRKPLHTAPFATPAGPRRAYASCACACMPPGSDVDTLPLPLALPPLTGRRGTAYDLSSSSSS